MWQTIRPQAPSFSAELLKESIALLQPRDNEASFR